MKTQHLKFGVFKLDNIGDFVLSVGALERLTQSAGEKNVALLVSEPVAPLAQLLFPLSRVIALPSYQGRQPLLLLRDLNKVRALVRGYQFDALVSLRHQRKPYHDLVLRLISANRSFGIVGSSYVHPGLLARMLRFSFSVSIPETQGLDLQICREIRNHAAVLSAVFGEDVSPVSILPRIYSGESVSTYLLVAPFGSSSIRDIPRERLCATIAAASKEHGCQQVILSGAAHQRSRLEELARFLRNGSVLQITVTTPESLKAFLEQVGAARCVVSAETAAAHLATAMDKPAVIFLGGGHFGQFAPWVRSSRQRWLFHPMDCFQCDWKCRFDRPLCLTEIDPDASQQTYPSKE